LVAKNICNFFGVAYKIIDVKQEFNNKIIKYFINDVKSNYTPNPCIMCNHLIKIKVLIDVMKKYKADFVATGHYAKIVFNKTSKEYELRLSADKKKDQTYFLSQLTQNQIKYLKLPLANYTKDELYKIFKKLGIKIFDKTKQSQDFCFVANKSYNDWLATTIGIKPGKIVDNHNCELGKHNGLHFYTIGQRKGINLANGPFYVLAKDTKTKKLVIVRDQKDLFKKEFFIDKINLINSQESVKLNNQEVLVQIRYGDKREKGKIKVITKNQFKIILKKPKLAITPGQFAVIYNGNKCLGSGRIRKDKYE